MTYPPLVIRADASVEIGTGHVMRCLALAQAWQDTGGSVTFCCVSLPSALHERLTSEAVAIQMIDATAGSRIDADATIKVAREIDAKWIVTDGYVFDADYQRGIKTSGKKLLFLDDYGHAEHYCADIVLNHNAYARTADYSNRDSDTLLLMGPLFTLLRREFTQSPQARRDVPELARNVLVTMGGSDSKQVTQKVMTALRNPLFQSAIVVGGSNPNLHEIRDIADRTPDMQVHVNVSNMPALMNWADMAVASASSTTWELATQGTPSILLVAAPNQQLISTFAQQHGLAVALGAADEVSPDTIEQALLGLAYDPGRRRDMSLIGQAMIDGRGAQRVTAVMQGNIGSRLRTVSQSDRGLIWLWANDVQTRTNSFHNDPIPWEAHCAWFERQITSNDVRFWILEHCGAPVGHIRYQVERPQKMATISFVVAPQERGKGYGTELLESTRSRALSELKLVGLQGITFVANPASGRAFEKAGFVLAATSLIDNRECNVFQWHSSALQ